MMHKVYDLRCDSGKMKTPEDLSLLSGLHPVIERFREDEYEQAFQKLSGYRSTITKGKDDQGGVCYEADIFRVMEMIYNPSSQEYIESGVYWNADFDDASKELLAAAGIGKITGFYPLSKCSFEEDMPQG